MIKKIILSILIIIATISFIALVIYMNRPPQQPPVSEGVKTTQPSVPQEITPVKPEGVPQEPVSVSKEIKKEKLPVPGTVKKVEPVPEEEKKEEPVPEEVTKEKAPVAEKSAKEISKLQEKCEKQSKKIFSKQYNDGTVENDKGLFLYQYKHHYNKKLNKCFMVITEDGDLERYKKLLDVDENNSYGSVRINNDRENMGCYLLNKKCSSEEGWDSIVKSYMEE